MTHSTKARSIARNLTVASLLSLSIASLLLGAPAAQAQAIIVAPSAPPPLRAEPMPGPRPGYVWDAGQWRWRAGRYVWVPGHWRPIRAGYRWAPGHWIRRGPQWIWVEGGWRR